MSGAVCASYTSRRLATASARSSSRWYRSQASPVLLHGEPSYGLDVSWNERPHPRQIQRPARRRISSSRGTSNEMTLSSGAPTSASMPSRASACAMVRGKPSSMKSSVRPVSASRIMPMTTASGTRSPASMNVLASTPSGVPSATAARSRSPVDRCSSPRSLRNSACVPLPAPGGPNSTRRAIAGILRTSASSAGPPSGAWCRVRRPPRSAARCRRRARRTRSTPAGTGR